MAIGRMLYNSISKSKKLRATKSRDAQLLYTWLLAHLDINANFNAEPEIVKACIVPMLTDFTEAHIATAMDLLEDNKLIKRYINAGEVYLHVEKWKQPGLRREKEKVMFPVYTHEDREEYLKTVGKSMESEEKDVYGPPTDRPRTGYGQATDGSQAAKGKGKEVKGNEDKIIKNFSLNVDNIINSIKEISMAHGYKDIKINGLAYTFLKNKLETEAGDITNDFEKWIVNNPSDNETLDILSFLTTH